MATSTQVRNQSILLAVNDRRTRIFLERHLYYFGYSVTIVPYGVDVSTAIGHIRTDIVVIGREATGPAPTDVSGACGLAVKYENARLMIEFVETPLTNSVSRRFPAQADGLLVDFMNAIDAGQANDTLDLIAESGLRLLWPQNVALARNASRELSPILAILLRVLLLNSHRPVDRIELEEAVWGQAGGSGPDTIKSHIYRLNRQLAALHPDLSVSYDLRRGYRLLK
ncbi:MAG: helix-turn-helix domain-containing protein [Ferrovibrio sp.]|uniref:helix-turn-helix domain-containing protein n=1 Tax=Ferrovibrio sp. TaxID=1917215 RepID=UPI003918C556